MRRYLFMTMLLLAIGLLIGCSSIVEAPAEEQSAEPTQEVVLEADILPAPSNTPPAAEPTEAPAGQAEGAVTQEPEAATAEPSPTTEPPTATAAPQINGQYEETYYRGLATAPITMIDYSDFL